MLLLHASRPAVRRLVRVATTGALALGVAVGAAGCSGGDDEGADSGRSPEEVMELAKQTFDETSGLSLALTTDDLPEGVTGISTATGVATPSSPAFDGTISIILAGQQVEVPVIAVDDTVYAQIPFTPGWSDVDPQEYGAPDPAQLVDSERGFSSLLPETKELEEGESVRGGADNAEVLTEYTGTVPGEAMQTVIPSAQSDTFDATYQITEDGELRQAVLTGVFYPASEPMTYTVDFSDYGSTPEITAP